MKAALQFVEEMRGMFHSMGDSGFLHLLMEPLLTYGVGFALLLYVVAWAAGEGKCRTFALLLLIVSCLMVYPYQEKRNDGAPRPHDGKYREEWSREYTDLWDKQTVRLRHHQYWYYGLAGLALLNVVLSPAGSIIGKLLGLMVLGAGCWVLLCSLWLNLHEKRIYRPDLRFDREGRRITWVVPDLPAPFEQALPS